MPSKAYSGQGLTVKIGTFDAVTTPAAADVFLEIGEVNDVDLPTPTADTIDVTHLKSTVKEFIAGLIDGGQAALNCNFINDDLGQLECREALTARQLRNFRFTFPTSMIPNVLDVAAIVTGMPQKAPTNDKVGLSINIKVSSVYAWSNA